MQKKRRNGSASTKRPVEDEIAHLRGLDLRGLRARWQSIFQRQAPTHLTRHLLFAVIAYRLQVDRFGDLDHATKKVLDRTIAKEAGPAMSSRLASFDQKRTRAYARNGFGPGMGSTVAAGDGDGRRLCLEGDRVTVERLHAMIADLQAQKVALHPEPEQKQ